MRWVALRMLVGDRAKFLGIIFGISFATLLMSQQVSIFVGLMRRTASQILDVRDAGIWVMDNQTRQIDEVPGLPGTVLQRVRGVAGVDWAVPLYKGQVRARLEGGPVRNVILYGLDDATLVGAPAEMIAGSLADLRRADAVIVDQLGHEYLWPGEPHRLGRVFEMNDRRAMLVGVCKASVTFMSMPIVYTRFSQAGRFVPRERNLMNFVLVRPGPGQDAGAVCREIESKTGLLALTKDQFVWKTIRYYMESTGIPVNFGITITLGFIVGLAVAGQTFYLFTLDNLRQFGTLKAMGVTNVRIVGMITLQGAVVGMLGYALGIGLTAAFFESTGHVPALIGLHLSWQAMLGVAVAVGLMVFSSSLVSIRRVLVLEPAVVFK